ncbi:hypothetical protein CALCODRAFT_536900 [Calocera cornea HHB12733]|uniref:Uncharacterized protein n=1 Tax=Calocera cornea HHB12733 TaxID=1353952 RepID=A0A165HJ50_9BASI|nr:hypothetical protein CALCODRAFT_536900 [Calocera cornea HHB12733]
MGQMSTLKGQIQEDPAQVYAEEEIDDDIAELLAMRQEYCKRVENGQWSLDDEDPLTWAIKIQFRKKTKVVPPADILEMMKSHPLCAHGTKAKKIPTSNGDAWVCGVGSRDSAECCRTFEMDSDFKRRRGSITSWVPPDFALYTNLSCPDLPLQGHHILKVWRINPDKVREFEEKEDEQRKKEDEDRMEREEAARLRKEKYQKEKMMREQRALGKTNGTINSSERTLRSAVSQQSKQQNDAGKRARFHINPVSETRSISPLPSSSSSSSSSRIPCRTPLSQDQKTVLPSREDQGSRKRKRNAEEGEPTEDENPTKKLLTQTITQIVETLLDQQLLKTMKQKDQEDEESDDEDDVEIVERPTTVRAVDDDTTETPDDMKDNDDDDEHQHTDKQPEVVPVVSQPQASTSNSSAFKSPVMRNQVRSPSLAAASPKPSWKKTSADVLEEFEEVQSTLISHLKQADCHDILLNHLNELCSLQYAWAPRLMSELREFCDKWNSIMPN